MHVCVCEESARLIARSPTCRCLGQQPQSPDLSPEDLFECLDNLFHLLVCADGDAQIVADDRLVEAADDDLAGTQSGLQVRTGEVGMLCKDKVGFGIREDKTKGAEIFLEALAGLDDLRPCRS